MNLTRARIGLLLVVGWVPFVVLGVLMTLSIWFSFVGVPLLLFAGAPFASGIRLLRNRERIRGQHAVGPLVSSVVLALAFGLSASVSHFTLDQKIVVAATATWIALLVVLAIALVAAWRGGTLDRTGANEGEPCDRGTSHTRRSLRTATSRPSQSIVGARAVRALRCCSWRPSGQLPCASRALGDGRNER